MLKVWMLFLLAASNAVASNEFTHIKLNPLFEQYLTQAGLESTPNAGARTMSARGIIDPSMEMLAKFRSSVLGSNHISVSIPSSSQAKRLGVSSRGDWTTPIPVDGEESLLYEDIREYLEGAHREITLGQVQQINLINRQFNLGTQNLSGFSWQKPFGVVHIYADRQVTPNLFGTNWLIQDTFTFQIEASTFLEKLNEAGLAHMSELEIGAFAGITFNRVYTYYHYANSYEEGLSADSSKLFLSFALFNKSGIERLGNEEILKREDNWTARAGGLISTPPVHGFSFSAGALAQYAFQQTTSVQSHITGNQRFHMSVIGKKSVDLGATMELQLDFFKLLQFSLLRFDLNYIYGSGKEFTLDFSPSQWAQVKSNAEQSEEIAKILRGSGEVKKLEPYVSRLDESSSSALQSRASVLIWGKLNKTKTEQIRVIKDDVVRVFFKNYSLSVKVVQNFWSRIFSAVVYKILKLPIGATNAAIYNRQLTMEYEATHPQAKDPSVMRVDATEQFSFVLNQSYDANRTDRWIDRAIKNDVAWFVGNFTMFPKEYKNNISSEALKGPLKVESNLRVEKAGFDYLLRTADDVIFGHMARVCGSKRFADWSGESSRSKLLNQALFGEEKCVKDMGHKFLTFRQDYRSNALKPSLAKFKSFMTDYFKASGKAEDLITLFGAENSFYHGRIQATTSQGALFVQTFSSGQFRGLGVIDNFNRASGSRAPASIINE